MTKGIDMYGRDEAIVEMKAKIRELEDQLTAARAEAESWQTRWTVDGARLDRLRDAIQQHLDTFGYDNREGLADALVETEEKHA